METYRSIFQIRNDMILRSLLTFLLLLLGPALGKDELVTESYSQADLLTVSLIAGTETLSLTSSGCEAELELPAIDTTLHFDKADLTSGLKSEALRKITYSSYKIEATQPVTEVDHYYAIIMVDRQDIFRQFGSFNTPYLLNMIVNIPIADPPPTTILDADLVISGYQPPTPLTGFDADVHFFVYRYKDEISILSFDLSTYVDGTLCKKASQVKRCNFNQAKFVSDYGMKLTFWNKVTVKPDAFAVSRSTDFLPLSDDNLCTILSKINPDKLVPISYSQKDRLKVYLKTEAVANPYTISDCSVEIELPATDGLLQFDDEGDSAVESYALSSVEYTDYTIETIQPLLPDDKYYAIIAVDRTAMFRQFGTFNKPYLLNILMNILITDPGPTTVSSTVLEISKFQPPTPMVGLDADVHFFVYRYKTALVPVTFDIGDYIDREQCDSTYQKERCKFDQAKFVNDNSMKLTFWKKVTVKSDAYALSISGPILHLSDSTVCHLLTEGVDPVDPTEPTHPTVYTDVLKLRFVSPASNIQLCGQLYNIRSTCLPVTFSAVGNQPPIYDQTVSTDVFRTQPEVVIEESGSNPWSTGTFCILMGAVSDPGTAFSAKDKPFIRWLVCDIPGGRVRRGRELVSYEFTPVSSMDVQVNRFWLFRAKRPGTDYQLRQYTSTACGVIARCLFDKDGFATTYDLEEVYSGTVKLSPGVWSVKQSLDKQLLESEKAACSLINDIDKIDPPVEDGYRDLCPCLGPSCGWKSDVRHPGTKWGTSYLLELLTGG